MRGRDRARDALLPLGVVTDVHELPATELLAAFRSRALSPREVIVALADRIERLDPELGAFTTLCLDRARDEAAAAERAYVAGSEPAPLAGLPFAAKDLFDSEGVRTTYGSRIFASHVPDRDAAAVAALRRAGAILVGKTQTHEFAWGITSINEAMGSSRNPWDSGRVSGGSSGGSAVAVAARMVPLALGSDTGGSIRTPAAFCGAIGFKPSYGRHDASGVWPLAPSLDHVGVMARSAADVALALGVLDEPLAQPAASLEGVTVVTCPDLHAPPPDPRVERAHRAALELLESLGARIEERPFEPATQVMETFRVIQGCEALRVHEQAGIYPERADDYGADVRARIDWAAGLDPRAYPPAAAGREAIRAAFGRLLAGGALLATPVAAVPPPRFADADALRGLALPYTTPQSLAGLPACSVPTGVDDLGLPTAVQLTAGPWSDGRLLAAVAAVSGTRTPAAPPLR